MTGGLVGRDSELQLIDTLVKRALGRRGGVLQLRGTAGIGKSVLLDVFAHRASARGLTVLRAKGAERTRQVSFGVAQALFAAVVAGLPSSERAAVLAGAARLAEPVVSGRTDSSPAVSDVGFARRQGLYWLTANLAQRRPLALFVDDFQWSDTPSRRFLVELAERLEGLPVLLVAAVRATDDDPANELSGPAHSLEPLADAQIVELLQTLTGVLPDSDTAARAVRVTRGNPFLVHELARSFGSRVGTSGTEDTDPVAPLGAAETVVARMHGLGSHARSLAEALAVLGTDAKNDTLLALAGVEARDGTAALAELRAAGLIPDADPLRFVHPLVHAAVDESLPDRARQQLHARAARLFRAQGADAELAAVHLLASQPDADADTVQTLRAAAADAGAQGAPERAVELYQHAVAFSRSANDGLVSAELLSEFGTAQASVGLVEDAVTTLREALVRAANPADAARVARTLASLLTLDRSTAAEAVAVLLATHDELPSDERTLPLLLLADVETASFVSLAAREAAQCDPRPVPANSDNRQLLAGAAMRSAMETGPAETAAELALRALGDGQLLAEEGAESPTFWLAALALIFSQDLLSAETVLRDADADASARGSWVGAGMVACFRSCLNLGLGRVADAETDARRFLELTPTAFALGPAFLVQALVERGELAEAAGYLAEASEPNLDSAMSHFLLRSRAAVHRATGELEAAERDLRDLVDGARAWDTRMPGPLLFQPMLVETLHARGAVDEARELLDETLEACALFAADSCTGTALRTAALLANDPDERLKLATRSVTLLGGTPARLEHARSLVALGQAYLHRREPRAAREPLRNGLQLARRCGATALAQAAHDGLTSAGLRPRKMVTGGLDSLTASERRVCTLVTSGMTNREIAEHLFVTVRTVETHLDRSFRKLGIHRRTELFEAMSGADDFPG